MGRIGRKIRGFLGRIGGKIKDMWNNRHRYMGQAQRILDTAHRVQQALPEGRLRERTGQALHYADQGMHHVRQGVRTGERIQEAVSGGGH